jgi:hypothetical protein
LLGLLLGLTSAIGQPTSLAAQDSRARLEQQQRDAEARRARIAFLQQRERNILQTRNWWVAQARDPNVIFILQPSASPFGFDPAYLPLVQSRSAVWEQLQNWSVTGMVLLLQSQATAQQLMQRFDEQSQTLKEQVEQQLSPRFDSQLDGVRAEFAQLMSQREQPYEGPRTGPSGRAWYFRRALVGADQTRPGFQLLESDADEAGGRVQVRGRVPDTNCSETWELSWRFGVQISRLTAGMTIPVQMQAQLVSAPCPSPLGTYINAGSSLTERFIMAQPPSNQLQGAIDEGQQQAVANGRSRVGTMNGTFTVRGNPGQSNSWTLFRFTIYMPGQSWQVGYIYLAGPG